MPRDDRSAAAREAWSALTPREVEEVQALLVRDRPEAVLQAVEALRRHQQVVGTLLRREAPEQRSGAS